MKLQTRGSEVEIIGAETEERVFSIQTSAVAFRTLSSNLYSDPMKAIIRELSCNAYDAHVEVGKAKKPFDLHLPTHLNPEFAIRDYGPGMSNEQVMDLYCTYFASSKQGTNKQIGGFGIGSKSPFSYTDSFTVISRQKGEKRTYSAFINEQQVPAVVRLSTEETEEADGLEVKFPANTKDIYAFSNKAQEVFEFFDPLPTINQPNFQVCKCQYSMEGKKWKLRKHDDYKGVRVIQGRVPYTVSGIEPNRNEKVSTVLNAPIDIFLPIGTLAVSANRETLTSEKEVVQKLTKIFEEIYDEVRSGIEQQVKDCGTGWEKMLLLNQRRSESQRAFKDVYDHFRREVLADTNLFGSTVLKASDYPNLIIRKYRGGWGGAKFAELMSGKNEFDRISLTTSEFLPSDTTETIEFVIVDRTFGGDRQIRDYVSQQPSDGKWKVVTAVFPSHPQQDATKFDMPGYLAEAEKFFKAAGNPKWELLSRLDIPKKEKVKPEWSGPTYRSWTWKGGSNSWLQVWNASEEARPKDGTHYYVKTDRCKVLGIRSDLDASSFDSLLSSLKNIPFLGLDSNLIVHNFTKSEDLPKRTKATWVNLLDYAVEKINAYISDPNNLVVEYISKDDLARFPGVTGIKSKEKIAQLPANSPLRKAHEIYWGDLDKTKRAIQSDILQVLSKLEDENHLSVMKSKLSKDDKTVRRLIREMKERYSLLRGKMYYSVDDDLTFFYIKAVDEQKELEAMYEEKVDEGSRAVGLG